MLILAFETSAKAASVALMDETKLLGEIYQNTGLTHSQTLMVMAQDLLKQCGKTTKDITGIAVAAGPGSFTGVRIGVAAAKGFSWGAELPCYGVSTLEAMAVGFGEAEGYICSVMDARRNQVYNGLFLAEKGCVSRIKEDRAIALEDLAVELEQLDRPIYLVGDGSELCYRQLKDRVANLRMPPQHRMHQRAVGVAMVAAEMAKAGLQPSGNELTVNYLRLSQAERERLERGEK